MSQDRLFDVGEPPLQYPIYARHLWITAPRPLYKKTMSGAAAIDGMKPAWAEWYRARGLDPLKQRTPLAVKLRAAVIEREGYVCGLCGGDVEPDDVHIDHITPVSLGGRDVLDNLQVTHSFCNLSKGARV